MLRSGLQVDIRAVPEESYGATLLCFAGSKAHSIALRGLAINPAELIHIKVELQTLLDKCCAEQPPILPSFAWLGGTLPECRDPLVVRQRYRDGSSSSTTSMS
jgi:hypothetical protein